MLRKVVYAVFVALLVYALWSLAAPAYSEAHHDRIYGPCDTEYGFVHMTYDDWAAQIALLEADGTIPPGVVFRYWEAEHDTGNGTNVQEDGSIPAWDQWARGLVEGQILSLDDWANGNYPEIEALMFASGLVAEWQLDASGVVRRFDDPYWAQANPLTPTWTVWQTLCMAKYGRSIPVYEMVDEVWTTNIPATTTTTIPPAPSTTQPPPTTTQGISAAPNPPSTTVPAPTTTQPPATTTAATVDLGGGSGLPDGYDLFDAEWDGYPFEQTILLLEERYPPGTPDRFHFRLSVAVEFLRQGGMVRGLDNLWESGS